MSEAILPAQAIAQTSHQEKEWSTAKVIYTVTEHGDQVVRALNEQTDRGSTLIPAVGGYTGEEKQIVMTITRRSVVAQTLRIIRMTDPKAFTFVMDSTEVHGEGFRAD